MNLCQEENLSQGENVNCRQVNHRQKMHLDLLAGESESRIKEPMIRRPRQLAWVIFFSFMRIVNIRQAQNNYFGFAPF